MAEEPLKRSTRILEPKPQTSTGAAVETVDYTPLKEAAISVIRNQTGMVVKSSDLLMTLDESRDPSDPKYTVCFESKKQNGENVVIICHPNLSNNYLMYKNLEADPSSEYGQLQLLVLMEQKADLLADGKAEKPWISTPELSMETPSLSYSNSFFSITIPAFSLDIPSVSIGGKSRLPHIDAPSSLKPEVSLDSQQPKPSLLEKPAIEKPSPARTDEAKADASATVGKRTVKPLPQKKTPVAPKVGDGAFFTSGSLLDLTDKAAASAGIDPAMLRGFVMHESLYKAGDVSSSGCTGLGQFAEKTFRSTIAQFGLDDPKKHPEFEGITWHRKNPIANAIATAYHTKENLRIADKHVKHDEHTLSPEKQELRRYIKAYIIHNLGQTQGEKFLRNYVNTPGNVIDTKNIGGIDNNPINYYTNSRNKTGLMSYLGAIKHLESSITSRSQQALVSPAAQTVITASVDPAMIEQIRGTMDRFLSQAPEGQGITSSELAMNTVQRQDTKPGKGDGGVGLC